MEEKLSRAQPESQGSFFPHVIKFGEFTLVGRRWFLYLLRETKKREKNKKRKKRDGFCTFLLTDSLSSYISFSSSTCHLHLHFTLFQRKKEKKHMGHET